MKDRPILFSGEMVRAILDGRKTQTRRVVKDVPCDDRAEFGYTAFTPPGHISCRGYGDAGYGEWFIKCPYGQPGDRLWVRESHLYVGPGSGSDLEEYLEERGRPENHKASNVWYRADGRTGLKWVPSIHMPRWASRITLEITDVRVERLQDISYDDCSAEGVVCSIHGSVAHTACAGLVRAYEALWDSINAKRAPWSSNPWVWVVAFKRVA